MKKIIVTVFAVFMLLPLLCSCGSSRSSYSSYNDYSYSYTTRATNSYSSPSNSSSSSSSSSSAKKEPAVGMTKSEVLASTWGSPMDKSVTQDTMGTYEIWFYDNYLKSISFRNGEVVLIVQ